MVLPAEPEIRELKAAETPPGDEGAVGGEAVGPSPGMSGPEGETETAEYDGPTAPGAEVAEQDESDDIAAVMPPPIDVSSPAKAADIPRYRPPAAGGRVPRNRSARISQEAPSETAGAALETRVQARIERSGNIEFALLLKRPLSSPEQLAVEISGEEIGLEARDDEWYESPVFPSVGSVLRDGLLATGSFAESEPLRWVLSAGRPFYIFTHEAGVGWANQTRLKLGLLQFVICVASWRDAVMTALRETCAGGSTPVPRDGMLPGWTVFGLFTPVRPVSPIEGDNLANLLRPTPDIEFSLDGGLWLRGNTWLAGFPPTIRISGQAPAGAAVLIDGIAADCDSNGILTAPRFDLPGTHAVSCEGRAASYAIAEPPTEWPETDQGTDGIPAGSVSTDRRLGRIFSVRMTNRVLIGSTPGQIFVCSPRFGPMWAGLVPFDPVWALPVDPLHCDRGSAPILQCADSPVAPLKRIDWRDRAQRWSAVNRWKAAVLDCSRKRLRLEPAACSDFWFTYLNEARRLRQILR